jgi:hypothetical protein
MRGLHLRLSRNSDFHPYSSVTLSSHVTKMGRWVPCFCFPLTVHAFCWICTSNTFLSKVAGKFGWAKFSLIKPSFHKVINGVLHASHESFTRFCWNSTNETFRKFILQFPFLNMLNKFQGTPMKRKNINRPMGSHITEWHSDQVSWKRTT